MRVSPSVDEALLSVRMYLGRRMLYSVLSNQKRTKKATQVIIIIIIVSKHTELPNSTNSLNERGRQLRSILLCVQALLF